jgi:hypothetical protein
MSDDVTRTEGEPHDRLTRLCAAMTDALDAHPERGDEKCIVFLQSEADKRGGLQLHGYEDDTDAMVDLFMHLRAMFKAQGKELMIAGLGGSPETN